MVNDIMPKQKKYDIICKFWDVLGKTYNLTETTSSGLETFLKIGSLLIEDFHVQVQSPLW